MNQIYVCILLLICICCSGVMKTRPLKATLSIMSIHLILGLTQSLWELPMLTDQGNAALQGIVEVILYTWFLRQVCCLNRTPPIFTKIKKAWFECGLIVNMLKIMLRFATETVKPLKMALPWNVINAPLYWNNGCCYWGSGQAIMTMVPDKGEFSLMIPSVLIVILWHKTKVPGASI